MLKLRGELDAIAAAEEAAREQAAQSLKALQSEYETAKARWDIGGGGEEILGA